MIARDTQREKVVERLAAHLLATGLSQASLRQLAAAAGTSDRMLLYYFADKEELLAAAAGRVSMDLAVQLATAIPEGADFTASALITAAVAITKSEAIAPYMALWIEIVAAAARGEAPFVAIAEQIVQGFLHWIDARLASGGGDDRAATVAMILAMIDGLALLRVCSGNAIADRAGEAMARLGASATNQTTSPDPLEPHA